MPKLLKKYIIFILFYLLNNLSIHAQDFQFTDNCQKAYKAFMSMKNTEGRAYLIKELNVNKNNFLPIILFNYDDFIS